jgi:hypothetical protein
MLSHLLVSFAIILVLLGFILWLVALLKPKILPDGQPQGRGTELKDAALTEAELLAKRVHLTALRRSLARAEQVSEVDAQIEALELRLATLREEQARSGSPPA